MKRTRWQLVLSLSFIAAFALAGCDKFGIAKPRIVQNTSVTGELAIAVGKDGSRHLAWRIPEFFAHTSIIYAFSDPGGDRTFIAEPPAYAGYLNPSLAVTENNTVYITWLSYDFNSLTYSTCWSSFVVTAINISCNPVWGTFSAPLPIPQSSYFSPQVISYGNTVYLTYFATMPDNLIHLFARRLSPDDPTIIDTNLTINPASNNEYFRKPALAISDSGTLQMAVVRKTPINGNLYVLNYEDGFTVKGIWDFITPLSDPALALDRAHDEVYYGAVSDNQRMVLVIYNLISHSITIRTNILPSGTWNIPGAPVFVWYEFPSLPILTGLYISFSGSKDGAGTDVYYCAYINVCTLNQVTNDGDLVVETAPKSVVVVEPDITSLVIAWRQYLPGTAGYKDVYTFDTFMGPRKVFSSFSSTPLGSLALASNGPYAAGSWIDLDSASGTRWVPWSSYNTNLVFLPVTRR